MVRLCAVVGLVSGERASFIFHEMPLRVVHSFEHIFYLREGYKVRSHVQDQELVKLMSSV